MADLTCSPVAVYVPPLTAVDVSAVGTPQSLCTALLAIQRIASEQATLTWLSGEQQDKAILTALRNTKPPKQSTGVLLCREMRSGAVLTLVWQARRSRPAQVQAAVARVGARGAKVHCVVVGTCSVCVMFSHGACVTGASRSSTAAGELAGSVFVKPSNSAQSALHETVVIALVREQCGADAALCTLLPVDVRAVGDTLRMRRLPNDPCFSLDDLWVVAQSLARVLEVTAACRVVHLDIKPANILLDRQERRAVVIDWELAERIPADRERVVLRSVRGTRGFMVCVRHAFLLLLLLVLSLSLSVSAASCN